MERNEAPTAPAESWVLALSCSATVLTCFLSDSRSRFEHASAPWPPAPGSTALPAFVLQTIAQGHLDALRLQLDVTLDAWPWEAELDGARAGLRVSRHLAHPQPGLVSAETVAARLGSGSRTDPHWVHGGEQQWAALALGLQAKGEPVLAISNSVPAERAWRFRAALIVRWGAAPWLSAAAALAAADTGVARGQWRLYDDVLFAPAPVAAGAEWRQVTSLSIDLVQSTGLLHEWGAEKYAQTHQAFHLLCRRVVEDLHGRIDDPQGDDGLMAYFGLQQAREDTAANAVRAAWTLTSEAPAIGFGVRIGITTGRVAVSDGLPFGAVIHLAARLQRIAETNGIVISEDTHALLGPGVVCDKLLEPVQLAGFARPQVAYRVLRLGPPQGSRWQRQGQGHFVGRREELALLKADWATACASRRGQYRCLVGEPGIGKTRLLQEFERDLRRSGDAATLLDITGHLEMQSSAFAALSLALEARGLPELAALLQSAPEGYDRDEVLHGLVAGSLRLAQLAPVCVVVDDAQWLDPSTIDFLERLRQAALAAPLLIVVSLREEARGLVQGLDTDAAVTLAALDTQESLDLIGALSDTAPLSTEVRRFIAGRAGGIPLFLEETVRMVGQLESDPDALVHGIPATLEALLTARLDALGTAKPMAQLAAVVGAEFPMSLWDALLTEQDDWIVRACAPDAWQKLLDSGVLGVVPSEAPRCRFHHALIRDAAYGSLWSRDRRQLHAVVARVLERHAVHGGTALRAHHLSAAGEPLAAFAAWSLAAREAAAAGADREALVLSQRALDLLPDLPAAPAQRQQALQLHLLQAARWIALDGYGADSVEAAYLRAAALCDPAEAGSMRIRVDLGLEACYAMRGDLDRARALAEAAVTNTPWEGNPRLALQARWAWTNVAFHQGDVAGALEMADQCLARYDPSLHHAGAVQDPALMFLCYSAWGLFQQGRADEARRRVRGALDLAATLQHPFSEAVAHGFAASVAMFCGDHAEGLQHAEEAIRRCSAKAFQAWLAHAQIMRGRLRAALGDLDTGLADMEEGLALWLATGARITASTYLTLQAEACMEHARADLALLKVRQGQDTARRLGERHYEAELLRMEGWVLWQQRATRDDAVRAQALLEQALSFARAQGGLGLALRAAVSLARARADAGRPQEAAALVAQALAAAPGQCDTLDARAARALLAEWSEVTSAS